MLKSAHIVSFSGYRSLDEFGTAFAQRRQLGQSLPLIVKMFAKRPVVCELCRDAIRRFSDAQAALVFEDEVLGVVGGTLFKSWTECALANGEKPGTNKWFSQVLSRHGFEAVKRLPGHNNARGWLGIRVKPVNTSTQWQNRTDP